MRIQVGALIAVVGCLAGCSGSDDDGGGVGPGDTGSLEAFAAYCTGEVVRETPLMEAGSAGVWITDGSQGNVEPGTTILIGASFHAWDAYLIRADGTPMKLHGDFETGLIQGTDFTSPCATDEKRTDLPRHDVLLATSSFFATAELSGEPCVLPAGTELTGFSFLSGGSDGAAQVWSNEIETQCGLTESYSSDIIQAELIDK